MLICHTSFIKCLKFFQKLIFLFPFFSNYLNILPVIIKISGRRFSMVICSLMLLKGKQINLFNIKFTYLFYISSISSEWSSPNTILFDYQNFFSNNYFWSTIFVDIYIMYTSACVTNNYLLDIRRFLDLYWYLGSLS